VIVVSMKNEELGYTIYDSWAESDHGPARPFFKVGRGNPRLRLTVRAAISRGFGAHLRAFERSARLPSAVATCLLHSV